MSPKRLVRIGLLAWAVAWFLAAVINAHWFLLSGNRFDLRIGYYLWWLSFVVLAMGFRRLSRGTSSPTPSD